MFPFDYAENEYRLLKEQLATGGITQQRFDVAVKNLIFTDAQGRFWRLGPNDGKWYVNDGQTWVEAQPPVMDIGAGQMKSTQPPSIPPWDPNSRYRQKN